MKAIIKMKILILSQEDINKTPPLLRITNMFEMRGHNISIACFGDGPQVMTRLFDYKERQEPLLNYIRPTSIRIMRPFLDIIRLSFWLIRQRHMPFDMVIAYNPIPLIALALLGKTVKGIKVYYSAELWDGPRFIFQRFCEKLSKRIPEFIINCQIDRQKILEERLKYTGPSYIIPNSCFDFNSRSLQNMKRENNTENVIFIYHGGLRPRERALSEMVKIVRSGAVKNVTLRLILRSQKRPLKNFKKIALSQVVRANIEIKEYVAYPDVFYELKQADIGVMLYKNVSMNYRLCAPNRLYEFAMLGMPVLASNQLHIANIVEKEKIGICVNPENVEEIITGIRYLCSEADLDKMGENARKWFLKKGNYMTHFEEFEAYYIRRFGVL